MKKLLLITLFIIINFHSFAANVYFLNGGAGYVYTNGQTFFSNQNGYAGVAYWLWADPARYSVDEWGARFKGPDGNWTDWSQLTIPQGMHQCLKAGTWLVEGRVHVNQDIWGGQNYYMYTSFQLYFYVVDNIAPTIPQNFTVSTFSTGDNAYPKLNWTINSELDRDKYFIERRITGQQNFSLLSTVSGNINQYVDYSVNYAGGGPMLAEYKIRVSDLNGNYSSYTNAQSIRYGDAWKIGLNQNDYLLDYKLEQNYPNPFNPVTTINYQIKEVGFVSLKVFDLLGNEITTLINEIQSPGYYSVMFNGKNLPSGFYVCQLKVNEFIENIKMTLLK